MGNLNVVRHVGRLVEDKAPGNPFELLHDAELLLLVKGMLDERGASLTRVSKVKVHANELMVGSSIR